VFLGAIAIGRLSVRSARDIAYAQRPVETTTTGSQPVIEQPVRQDPVLGQQPVGQQTGYGPAADQPVGQQTGYGPAADQPVGQQTGYGPVADQQQVGAAPRRRGLLSRLRNRGGGNTLARR
jgi:hypothetical protein